MRNWPCIINDTFGLLRDIERSMPDLNCVPTRQLSMRVLSMAIKYACPKLERVFPIFSPLISQIEVLKKPTTVRRAKLYYLRDRKGDSMKINEHSFKATVSLQPTAIDESKLEVIETLVTEETPEVSEAPVETAETPAA